MNDKLTCKNHQADDSNGLYHKLLKHLDTSISRLTIVTESVEDISAGTVALLVVGLGGLEVVREVRDGLGDADTRALSVRSIDCFRRHFSLEIPSSHTLWSKFCATDLPNILAIVNAIANASANPVRLLNTAIGEAFERIKHSGGCGVVFTPGWFAKGVVDHALCQWESRNTAHGLDGSGIPQCLDMSVGSGEFLIAFVELIAPRLSSLLQEGNDAFTGTLNDRVHAWDIQADAVAITQLRLWMCLESIFGLEENFRWPQWTNCIVRDAIDPSAAMSQPQPRLVFEAETSLEKCNQKYGLIVGNPPYVALSQGNNVRNKAAFIARWNNAYPDYLLAPTADLSNYIMLHAIQLLEPNGVLEFITSRNFFDTQYGDSIRRFLLEKTSLNRIVTLHSHPFTKPGMKVKSNTVIIELSNEPPFCETVSWAHSMDSATPLHDLIETVIDRKSLLRSPNWTEVLFPDRLSDGLIKRCDSKVRTYFKTAMGVKSGANEVFLWDLRKQPYKDLERSLPCSFLVPAVKNSREITGSRLPAAGMTPFRYLVIPAGTELCVREEAPDPSIVALRSFLVSKAGGVPQCCPNSADTACNCTKKGSLWDTESTPFRPSVAGHRPHWYNLTIGESPRIAVQCIVDTEIGIFWNSRDVWPSDQFQVILSNGSEAADLLLFSYLQSFIARLMLENRALHRARYDGSFMLKIQVSHLADLPCPDFSRIPPALQAHLTVLAQELIQESACDVTSNSIRRAITELWLGAMGVKNTNELSEQLEKTVLQKIEFRWEKDRHRAANQCEVPRPA